jgi:hypothetical protein
MKLINAEISPIHRFSGNIFCFPTISHNLAEMDLRVGLFRAERNYVKISLEIG